MELADGVVSFALIPNPGEQNEFHDEGVNRKAIL